MFTSIMYESKSGTTILFETLSVIMPRTPNESQQYEGMCGFHCP